MDMPLKSESLDELTMTRITGNFPGAAEHGFTKIKPGNCLVASSYSNYMEKIYSMELRSDDIFVLSWPKNGTTWTQEMVWCIYNDYDFEAAKSERLDNRIPFLEMEHILDHLQDVLPPGAKALAPSIDTILDRKSPRIFKSHLPFYALPPKLLDTCRVVICLRNPKDTVVSYYHHHKLFPVSFLLRSRLSVQYTRGKVGFYRDMTNSLTGLQFTQLESKKSSYFNKKADILIF